MPKSRQRKAHKVKKQKFIKAQVDAKKLYEHKRTKFLNEMFDKLNKQRQEEQLNAGSSDIIQDAVVVEEIQEGLDDLKKGLSEDLSIVDTDFEEILMPEAVPNPEA